VLASAQISASGARFQGLFRLVDLHACGTLRLEQDPKWMAHRARHRVERRRPRLSDSGAIRPGPRVS
jgi:hypothetical protein